jgi:hypothetical protein
MSDEKRADDEAVRRTAEIGTSIDALTGPAPLQGPKDVIRRWIIDPGAGNTIGRERR